MKAVLLQAFIVWSMLSAQTHTASITAKGTYTTSTRFLYERASFQAFDNATVLESNFGYGADIRWQMLWDRFFMGVSFEQITGTADFDKLFLLPQSDYLIVPSQESFELRAVEISGYYVVPISSENVQFYLGGGFGLYEGDWKNTIASATSATTGTTSNIGIHVLTGVEYRIVPRIALRGELKFRDPHFNVTAKFDKPTVDFMGYPVPLPNEETTTVNLYGVNYMLGIVFQL